jgi:four helix bundle protein
MRWKTSLRERVFVVVIATLKLYPRLAKLGPPYAHIGLQLFRSTSSVGAALEEGTVGASNRDMGSKHAIALREAKEANYWLRVLIADEKLVSELIPLRDETGEFIAMLTVSVKKLRTPKTDSEQAED